MLHRFTCLGCTLIIKSLDLLFNMVTSTLIIKSLDLLFNMVTSLCLILACFSVQRLHCTLASKGPFTNTYKGGPDAKNIYRKNFVGAPLQTAKKKKKKSGPPFLPSKLQVNPIEKLVNSIFNGKSVVIFFRAPLQGSKILRAPLFASGPPYKRLWMVNKTMMVKQDCFYNVWVEDINLVNSHFWHQRIGLLCTTNITAYFVNRA